MKGSLFAGVMIGECGRGRVFLPPAVSWNEEGRAAMLHYPKIPGSRHCPTGRCLAFEKYDGTNLHWAWDRDFGWHAFGTRRDQFNLLPAGIAEFARRHDHLRQAPDLFLATLADDLERIFQENSLYRGYRGFKAFTEFLGPGSFAGLHRAGEPKRLVLFDVWAEGFGLVGPGPFVADFGNLPIARVVYEGKLTGSSPTTSAGASTARPRGWSARAAGAATTSGW